MLSHGRSGFLEKATLSRPGGPNFERRRRIGPAIIALSFGAGPACQAVTPTDDLPLDPEVRSILRAEGEVNVVIVLVDPPGYGDPLADQERIRADIARMQGEVVEALGPANYRDRRRFVSVPAMAGALLTERGLDLLLAHSLVRRVDRDLEGTGLDPP